MTISDKPGLELMVSFFGAARDLAPRNPMTMPFEPGMRVSDLRESLRRSFSGSGAMLAILDASAIADEERVLAEDSPLAAGSRLAILPPVSGG